MVRKAKEKRGITLIALVVTIVVLLILAGITINMLFSNGGIFKTAQDAANAWNEATVNEQESLNNLADQIANLVNGQVGGGDTSEEPWIPPTTVEEAIAQDKIFEETKQIKDNYDNTVTVPKGFKVTDEGTTVPDGIVIEDGAGNQFVWIPTGMYKVDASGTTKTNDLTRRQWGRTANVEQAPTLITGDEKTVGSGNQKVYFGEGDTRSVAHETIENFLNSAKPVSEGGNGGFYIGRYEQGKGNVCKAGVSAYVSITRDAAKAQAEAMHTNKKQYGVTSELISSYAWDTALNFICQNSEHGYKLATTTESTYGNIGTSNKTVIGGTPVDCYSNIYDILGNCEEWTTEYSSFTVGSPAYPCVFRGGYYSDSGRYTGERYNTTKDGSADFISFRLSLYV